MRKKARVDLNQNELVEILRKCGASVQSLATVGNGCPDLLVGFMGQTHVLEVKSEKGKLTDDQEKWFRHWQGSAGIIRNENDVLKFMKKIREAGY